MYNSKKQQLSLLNPKKLHMISLNIKPKNIFLKINFGHIYIVTILNNLTLFIRII